jgi:hypothetical protein
LFPRQRETSVVEGVNCGGYVRGAEPDTVIYHVEVILKD